MALSKIYTLAKVESQLRILTQTLGLNKIRFGDIRAIVNKNTIDIAELLNGAAAPFYQDSAVLNDSGSSYKATVAQNASYNATTGVVNRSGHGYTAADVGKRVVLWDEGDPISKVVITEITSYVDANNFGTRIVSGASSISAGECDYAVFADHSTSYLDISSLKIDRIIKLVSSNLGEFTPAKDSDFENLANIDDYDNDIFYNHAGEKLHLKKGSSVATAYGTITLDYYRLPTMATARTDYIDMKDNYIPLLIDRCKLDLYEMADKAAPTNLADSVTTKVRELMAAGSNKDLKIKDKASG